MAYLRLLANPDDDSAFLRVINTPRREIGTSTLDKLSRYAGDAPLLPARGDRRTRTRRGPADPRRSRDCASFPHGCAAWHAPPNPARRSTPCSQLLRDLDYRDWLNQTSNSDKVAERRWENVEELVGWLEKLQDRRAAGAKPWRRW